jgi:hypothetical protein
MNLKKLLLTTSLATLLTTLSTTSNSADKIGVTQDLGVLITGSYNYVEPNLMRNKSSLDDHLLDNFGLIYNLKNSFQVDGYLNQLELDTDFRRIKYDYWSNGTGTKNDKDNDVYNLRALYGIQASDKLMLKTGLGYRHLFDKSGGTLTSTGHSGYDRIQEYQYVPFIAELSAPIGSVNGKLKLEYDHIFYGKNVSKLGQVSGNSDKRFRNDDGYMVKIAYKIPYAGINIEPYFDFQRVEDSTVDSGYQEPRNYTQEWGVKFTKTLGEENLKSITNSKRLISKTEDNYYLGVGALHVKTDTNLTGGTNLSIDEESWGYSLFAGKHLNEFLDLEVAFNYFGEAITKGTSSSGTITHDGTLGRGGYASPVSYSGNNFSITYRSNSASIVLKPKYNIDKNFKVNAIAGFHRYDQIESLSFPGAHNNTEDFGGTDLVYGIGASYNDNNLSIGLDFRKYEMRFDAEALMLSASYKF